jgi:NAD(P)-dependent dehydrogenase (short-subunit alcohol dehydrogenase family)
MQARLEGKVAIVTGSGQGIGKAIALELARQGAVVVTNSRQPGTKGGDAGGTASAIEASGGRAVAHYCDVSDFEAAAGLVQAALDSFGKLDILVNNAGVVRDRLVFNMTEEDWDVVIKVHLYGHFNVTRHACAVFRRQRSGRIINTSSIAGLGLTIGQANYAAAKEGIVGLTRMVARDMGTLGVTCNAIRPNAATRLTLSDELKASWTTSGMEQAIRHLEQMRPEDIAPLVVYLASDEAANVNGRVFLVQTGRVSLYSEPAEEKTVTSGVSWSIDEMFRVMPSITSHLINQTERRPRLGISQANI